MPVGPRFRSKLSSRVPRLAPTGLQSLSRGRGGDMRSMAHPQYERTRWTPERRKAASERAKAYWRKRKAEEEARRARKSASPVGKSADEIARIIKLQNEIAAEWHRLDARKKNLIEAHNKMREAFDILETEGLGKWLTWLND